MASVCAFAYPNMIVEHYTAERGLPNNIVNCTLKGTDGFVWFGTWYGLCSFDGAKFRSYDNRDGFYSADIPPRKIQRIVEDKNGFYGSRLLTANYIYLTRSMKLFMPSMMM